MNIRTVAAIGGLYLVLAAAVFVLWPGAAWPHSWYDASCCSGVDCHPIPVQGVRVTPGGWEVTIEAGAHPFVKEKRTEFLPWDDPRIRRSLDGDFHACVTPVMGRFLCFYTPDMGS